MHNSDNPAAAGEHPVRREPGAPLASRGERLVVAAFVNSANIDKAVLLAEYCASRSLPLMAAAAEPSAPLSELEARGARIISCERFDPQTAALKAAAAAGFSHILAVDPTDASSFKPIASFIKIMRKFPHSVVLGRPVPNTGEGEFKTGPARRAAKVLAALECLSASLEDPYCPFRLYPVALGLSVASSARSSRFACADYELLVRMMWAGARIRSVSVPFDRLPQRRCSTLRAAAMHAGFLAGAIARLPILLWSRFFGWAPQASYEAAGSTSPARAAEHPIPQAESAPKPRRALSTQEADRAAKAQRAAFEARRRAEEIRSSINAEH